jgi:hypothetical protein
MLPWIIAGAIVIVVLAVAIVFAFRLLVIVAESETVDDTEEDDEFSRPLLPSLV